MLFTHFPLPPTHSHSPAFLLFWLVSFLFALLPLQVNGGWLYKDGEKVAEFVPGSAENKLRLTPENVRKLMASLTYKKVDPAYAREQAAAQEIHGGSDGAVEYEIFEVRESWIKKHRYVVIGSTQVYSLSQKDSNISLVYHVATQAKVGVFEYNNLQDKKFEEPVSMGNVRFIAAWLQEENIEGAKNVVGGTCSIAREGEIFWSDLKRATDAWPPDKTCRTELHS